MKQYIAGTKCIDIEGILLCLLCGEGILQIPREGVIAADRGGGTGILLLSEIETKYLYLYFYRAQV